MMVRWQVDGQCYVIREETWSYYFPYDPPPGYRALPIAECEMVDPKPAPYDGSV